MKNSVRHDLSKLAERIDELVLPKEATANDNSGTVREELLALTGKLDIVAANVAASDGMRKALLALTRKVEIVAANVLGTAEDVNEDASGISDLLML